MSRREESVASHEVTPGYGFAPCCSHDMALPRSFGCLPRGLSFVTVCGRPPSAKVVPLVPWRALGTAVRLAAGRQHKFQMHASVGGRPQP
jgi:hypothetical protein